MSGGRARRKTMNVTLGYSIVGVAFSVGLILGGLVTGLFAAWPPWLYIVLGVSLLIQVVIWGWHMRARKGTGRKEGL